MDINKDEIVDKLRNATSNAVEKAKSVKDIRVSRANVHSIFESLQSNGKFLFLTIIVAVVVMLFFCSVVFFLNVKGPEKVMVPEVCGKQLSQALIEMQNKELYPKITLRYSEVPGDENTILDQSPSAGSIVKGYSRVNLVVSRGVVVDKIENYVGMNYDELKMKLQTLFAGSVRPLIVLDTPVYKADLKDAGTIIEQDPPEGTEISEPIKIKLVVSRGPTFENTRVPNLIGKTIPQIIEFANSSKIIFDFTSCASKVGEKSGVVVSQEEFSSDFIKIYSRMNIEIAMPTGEVDKKIYGIFKTNLTEYPYPVPMRLVAVEPSGEENVVADLLHTGGSFTMPFIFEKNTILTLYIDEKAVSKYTVH